MGAFLRLVRSFRSCGSHSTGDVGFIIVSPQSEGPRGSSFRAEDFQRGMVGYASARK